MDGMSERSIEILLGEVKGKLEMVLDEQRHAAASRKETYAKLETMDRKIDAADAKIDVLDERMQAVEEPVAEFSKWRERGVGAVMLISLAAASVGGLVATFGKKLWAAIVGG